MTRSRWSKNSLWDHLCTQVRPAMERGSQRIWSMLYTWKLIASPQAWKKRMLSGVSNEQKEDWTPGYMQAVMPPDVWFGYCGRLALSVIMPEQHICCRPCACPGSSCWQRLCSRDSYSLMESGKYSLYFLSWRIKKVGMLWQETVSEASLNREQPGEVERLASHSYAL